MSAPVVIVDAEIIETPTSTSPQQVIVSRNTVVDYCGDGDGCSLRLLVIASQPKIETGWFAIVGSDDWTLKGLDESSHFGSLSDFTDDTILFTDRNFPQGSQTCTFREHTVAGTTVSLLAFALEAGNTLGNAHRCVLHIED